MAHQTNGDRWDTHDKAFPYDAARDTLFHLIDWRSTFPSSCLRPSHKTCETLWRIYMFIMNTVFLRNRTPTRLAILHVFKRAAIVSSSSSHRVLLERDPPTPKERHPVFWYTLLGELQYVWKHHSLFLYQ